MFEAARQMGLEGILAKDRASTYEAGRSTRWLKLKVLNEQEFSSRASPKESATTSARWCWACGKTAKLRHAGQVGTGFDQKLMKAIYERLKPLITKTSPFAKKPNIRTGLKNVTWVRPEVVCQVRFLEWTQDGILRAPVFVGLAG